MSRLAFDNVTLKRNGKDILGPLTLALEAQGITCLLGPNGAGKSVFLNLCHGMFAPSNGAVEWDDQAATHTRKNRSFMFQTAAVMRRSVRQNIAFPLIARKTPKKHRDALVVEALHFARLSDQAAQPAASLSGGEKQRMALARAWVSRPDVILLDEPSANLDPGSTRALEEMLLDIAKKSGVIIATHDLAQARRLADHVLVFSEGNLVVDTAADIFFRQKQVGVVSDFLEGRI